MSDVLVTEELQGRMSAMLDMLNEGRILDTLVEFYAPDACVYENDNLFAESRAEAYARQQPFVEGCSGVYGAVRAIYRDLGRGIVVLENKTRYDHPDYGPGEIDGVHVLYWYEGLITREEYFSGARAAETANFWSSLKRSATS
ncbi:MAG: hypothetical protein HWE25_02805 [Alphaproteobacteria bacterium]|nr:hypothetical protein [Alphaproteobacteria bacterium]